MTSEANNLQPLIADLHAVFASADHPAAQRLAGQWPRETKLANVVRSANLPVTCWLGQSINLASSDLSSVVGKLAHQSENLCWQQTYTAEDFGSAFLNNYGWTMLVGPDAPAQSDRLLAGFLLLGPGVEYPVHQHSAEEVYIVVSGTASWLVGEQDWTPKDAGQVIHNPPWQWHGMRTDQGEPLLLAFAWNAGVVEKSKIARR